MAALPEDNFPVPLSSQLIYTQFPPHGNSRPAGEMPKIGRLLYKV